MALSSLQVTVSGLRHTNLTRFWPLVARVFGLRLSTRYLGSARSVAWGGKYPTFLWGLGGWLGGIAQIPGIRDDAATALGARA